MKVKRIISLILALITVLFSFVACDGELVIGNNVGNTTGSSADTSEPSDGGDEDNKQEQPELNNDPTDDFTVTLMADGEPYKPRMDMLVYWNDGFSVHAAPVNEEGVARIDGLDGDYRVTLSAVPNEYAYDPNNNIATNEDRNIVVNLYTMTNLTGGHNDEYNCYNFRYTGVYSAIITGPDQKVFIEYAPSGMGTYTIESWMDVTADNVNPYIDVYGGTFANKWYETTTDGGGTVGSYTINFVHTVQIAKENISGGGQATYTFAVGADVKNNRYPVTVVFAVKRDGDFELVRPVNPGGSGNSGKGGVAISEHDFSDFNKADHEYDKREYKTAYPEYLLSGNTYVFDEKNFKIWKRSEGGDDFYHVYSLEKYPETNGYGPILYANITSTNRFVDRPFNLIDYNDKGEVVYFNLVANGVDYKHFIEGYTALATQGKINGGSYYCVNECTCHGSSTTGRACTDECTTCHADCRRIKEELIGFEGYQYYANTDGRVPVTAELKDFLVDYASKQQFFYDGIGTAEKYGVGGKLFQAVGTSGWLFGCCYYEKR